MPSLTLMRGFSSSGKSTLARQLIPVGDAVIVSRDHIRQQMTGHRAKVVLPRWREELVTTIEHAQITAALEAGVDVVVDNTNLTAKFARQYLNIAADLGAYWEVLDVEVGRDECLRRNAARPEEDRVPEDVIYSQAKRFPLGTWPTLKPGDSHFKAVFEPYIGPQVPPPVNYRFHPEAFAFDIDGTLAHHEGVRDVYDTSKYHLDAVDTTLRSVLDALRDSYWSIVILSGRDSAHREATEDWLHANGIEYDFLMMRPEGDRRRDDVVKSELLDQCPYRIKAVFDDRDRVVSMWRARGVPAYQVARGAF